MLFGSDKVGVWIGMYGGNMMGWDLVNVGVKGAVLREQYKHKQIIIIMMMVNILYDNYNK
jgi:hypothetical protein